MMFACPESHHRSLSACGNIAGTDSGSSLWAGVLAAPGGSTGLLSCAAAVGTHKKHTAASSNHARQAKRRSYRGILCFPSRFGPPGAPRASNETLTVVHQSLHTDERRYGSGRWRQLTTVNPGCTLRLIDSLGKH